MANRKYPTIEQVEEMDGEQQGWCIACGEIQDGCEPDAEGYECESCGCQTVYGAAECALRGWVN